MPTVCWVLMPMLDIPPSPNLPFRLNWFLIFTPMVIGLPSILFLMSR